MLMKNYISSNFIPFTGTCIIDWLTVPVLEFTNVIYVRLCNLYMVHSIHWLIIYMYT